MKLKIFILITLLFILIGCVQAVKTTNEEVVKEKEMKQAAEVTLFSLGRASIRLEFSDGRVVYIDPYGGQASDYDMPADLVLVTHQHSDHNQLDLVTLKSGGTVLQCPEDIHAGENITLSGLEVTAVAAYNENHPKAQGCGYIIAYGDLVIYHSGDTSKIEEMDGFKAYDIDYALLCMDGYYNMGPDEAMEVAERIEAKHVIPIHTAKTGDYDAEQADKFSLENRLLLAPGESVRLIGE